MNFGKLQFSRIRDAAMTAIEGKRGYYIREVLRGRQCLSGADLAGNAKKWGSWYANKRSEAIRAWYAAGGCEARHPYSGRRMLAVPVCVDDFGDQIILSDEGELYRASTDSLGRDRYL